MSRTENLKKAQRAASSPAARAKAVATMKARRAAKLAAQQGQIEMSLDAIPDHNPRARKKYTRKQAPSSNLELAKTLLRTALALLE